MSIRKAATGLVNHNDITLLNYHARALSAEQEVTKYAMNATREKEINEIVRGFVLSAVSIPDLRNDDDLFQSGIVNSLFAIQLMTFIEKAFSIEVGSDDLDIENFKSINATTVFIVRKNGQEPRAQTEPLA